MTERTPAVAAALAAGREQDLKYISSSSVTALIEAAAPHITDARWQALKDYLSQCIAADEAVRLGLVADGEDEKAAPFGGLVSANRSTLKKMRELENGR